MLEAACSRNLAEKVRMCGMVFLYQCAPVMACIVADKVDSVFVRL